MDKVLFSISSVDDRINMELNCDTVEDVLTVAAAIAFVVEEDEDLSRILSQILPDKFLPSEKQNKTSITDIKPKQKITN